MSCNNKYCSIRYDPAKEPCKSCKHNVKGNDMFSYLQDIVNGKK